MSRFRNITTALAAMLLVGAPTLSAADFQSGDTKMSLYGFVISYAKYYVNGNDDIYGGNDAGSMFYNTSGGLLATNWSGIPTGGYYFDFYPTRFGFASTTPSANLGDIKTKIEFDMNGGGSSEGGYALNFRHFYVSFDGWTFGKTWINLLDQDAEADTVDWAGPIGSASYDVTRDPQIMWTGKLDKNNSLTVALEMLKNSSGNGFVGAPGGQDQYKVPAIVAAWSFADSWGHVRLAGAYQQANYNIPATTAPQKDSTSFSKSFAVGQLSGDVKFGKDDLVWQVYYGNPGGMGTGIQCAYVSAATQNIVSINQLGWLAGYTHHWTDDVRSNIVVSGVQWKSDSSTPATTAWSNGTSGPGMKTAYYGEINTLVKLAKTVTFGVAYDWEQAKAFGSANPWFDYDGTTTTKISNNKIQLSLEADF